jgi:hypothetical protein
MNLLIPYVDMNHPDPLFSEYTYGDRDARGKRLLTLKPGDHIFFHTTLRGVKAITAYYIVDRVLPTRVACADPRILLKFLNPHIEYFKAHGGPMHGANDVIVFGDPILSAVLRRPLPFDRGLANRLSLGIRFPPGKSEAQAIGQATRSWRNLTSADVRVLLSAARRADRVKMATTLVRSTDEVAEIIEKDVEEHLARNPSILGKGLKLKDRQLTLSSGRVDLLFQAPRNELLLVEVKLGKIGRDAISQIEGYAAELRASHRGPIRAAIVCAGVMPAFADDIRRKKAIKVLVYGWKLHVQSWQFGPA